MAQKLVHKNSADKTRSTIRSGTHNSGSSRFSSLWLIVEAGQMMIVNNLSSKRSMKNSVTFISISFFSYDNGPQKRQKFIPLETF